MPPNENSVKVLIGPSKIGGVIGRLVELPDGSGRVETWSAKGWVKGGASVDEFFFAPPASEETLREFGVIS